MSNSRDKAYNAIQTFNPRYLDLIINTGVNVNQIDSVPIPGGVIEKTLLSTAVAHAVNSLKCIDVLLKHGAKPDSNTLQQMENIEPGEMSSVIASKIESYKFSRKRSSRKKVTKKSMRRKRSVKK